MSNISSVGGLMPEVVIAKILRSRSIAFGVLLVVGAAAGASIEHYRNPLPAAMPAESEHAKSGPWGELSYAPFTIAAPEEALPVRLLTAKGTHWKLPRATEADVRALLEKAEVPAGDRAMWLTPEVLHEGPDGVDWQPAFAALRALSDSARREIYRHLAQFPENLSELTYLHKGTLEERFADSGLARETLTTFRHLCCEHGDYLVFSGLGAMLAEMPEYDERVRFLKALTRQKTMLLRLHVGPESNIASLARYWGKGSTATDVRTMLQSVAKVKGGTWVDILTLLPPLPSSHLYTYPLIPENALDGTPITRDCHWTSLNFFHATPDPNFSDPTFVRDTLRKDYYPVPGDPEYGDLVLFTKPNGEGIHSAVYLADDIVFSKNGSTAVYPWMLCTVSDLLKRYSFQVPPDQRLIVTYLRRMAL